jgi:hypothetical protein
MSSAPRDLRLLVLPVVALSNLNEHDREYGGVYRAETPAEMTDLQAYQSIMDSFHHAHALRRPDDFIYQIWDAQHQIEAPCENMIHSQVIALIKEARQHQVGDAG